MPAPTAARIAHSRPTLTPTERIQRRRLIFQDSLSLLGLILIATCIAVLTSFFSGSFQEHRRVLEKRWFARGQEALASGRPADAVQDFRSALALSAGNADYEMALAQALADSGHTEEAYTYFSSLHDAAPGDGFLNLQLARLAVRRHNPARAVAFYQAALNGLWYGEGTERRLQIRLELANYLLSRGRANEAQGQLLAAEGNSLDQPTAILDIANLLVQAADPSDAWTAYGRVESHPAATPSQVLQALQGEAEVAQSMGQYKRAAQALDRYIVKARQHPGAATPQEWQAVRQQRTRLQRMLQLIPFYALPPKQHSERVLLGAAIAHRRYASCLARLRPAEGSGSSDSNSTTSGPAAASATAAAPAISSGDSAALTALGTQWTQELQSLQPANLAGNAPLEQTLMNWTNRAEILTAKLCGPPTGNDALLLQLAQTPDKTE
ncbi:MAG: tetratricopeptide repeat protein [Acidobacteriaceae bacterium]